MSLTTERSVGEHTFRTNVRVPRPRAAGVGGWGAALGSCEGAAAGSCEGAAPDYSEGAGMRRQNLTFKIKFSGSCVVVEI